MFEVIHCIFWLSCWTCM